MDELMPLDWLLDAISEDSNHQDSTELSSTTAAGEQNLINNSNPSVPEAEVQNIGNCGPSSNSSSLPPSPLNPRLAKFLSSSSLKRKQKKNRHCKYCVKFCFNRRQIEEHLLNTESCSALYQRELKVSSVNGVLIKIYKCISCSSTENLQLKRHLETYSLCFKFYLQKFQVTNWDELKTKLFNLTRSSYKSRTSLKRRLENAASAARKKDSVTVTQALNSFRQDIAIANFRLCIICQQNFLPSGAVEILPTDNRYEELESSEKVYMKRMQSYWICLLCDSSNKENQITMADPIFNVVETEGYKLLYPTDQLQQVDIDVQCNNLVLIPTKLKTTFKTTNYSLPLYKNLEVTNDLVSSIYLNRTSKFALRNIFGELYNAVISNNENKKLQSISKIYDDSMIRCSTSWDMKKRNGIFAQFKQYGQAAIGYSIDVSLNNLETIITSKLCQGIVVTLEYHGDFQDIYQTKYFVHDHDNSTACTDTCNKTEVTEVQESLESKFLPIFISSLSQKHHCFLQHFIKNKNFHLYSNEYMSDINFYLNGSARINGIIWPTESASFNEMLSSCSLDGNEPELTNYLHYIESSILATTNQSDIQLLLGVSQEEALQIRNLAVIHQLNFQMNEKYVPLPSFETMMRMKPSDVASVNLISSKRLLQLLKQVLMGLCHEEKNSLRTEDWLEDLNTKAKFNSDTETEMTISFNGTKIFFTIDERLENLMAKYGCFAGKMHL